MDRCGGGSARVDAVRVVGNSVNSNLSTVTQFPNRSNWRAEDTDEYLELMKL